MSKMEEVLDACRAQMKQLRIRTDDDLLKAIAKSMGPSLYRRDARTVATGQKSELETIKKNFLIKKLGCEDGPALDKAIDKVTERIGRSNRNKLRPVFYYLLVKQLRKTSVYS
jgi:hypothetical protein